MGEKHVQDRFIVSVIIPVYNAERYLRQAVDSVLLQREVGEIILIDDGSKDESLQLCKFLARNNPRIKYLTHNKNMNLGPAATRNLGIQNARYPYIGFLDADDFYLKNRYIKTREIFSRNEQIDGVYEAIGTFFESDEAKKRWRELGVKDLTTIQKGISPKALFYKMSPIGNAGHCHLDGLTIRKKLFKKTGYFDINLLGPEDTAFFIKLSAVAQLMPGNINKPVARRRIHATNQYTHARCNSEFWRMRLSVWLTVLKWLKRELNDQAKENQIIGKILWDAHGIIIYDMSPLYIFFAALYRYLLIIFKEPNLILNKVFIFGVVRHLRQNTIK